MFHKLSNKFFKRMFEKFFIPVRENLGSKDLKILISA